MLSVMLYPCMFCAALLMDLFVLCVACLTVFGETIRIMYGCVCYLLLNVMELLYVGGGALLGRPCMVFDRMCVLCMWSQ